MDIKLDKPIPAIAIRGIVPFPDNKLTIDVGRKASVEALNESSDNFDGYIILVIQKNPKDDYITEDNVERVGVLAQITAKEKRNSTTYRVKFDVLNRVVLNSFETLEPYLKANCDEFVTLNDEPMEHTITYLRKVITEVLNNAHIILTDPKEVRALIIDGLSTEKCVDILVNHMKITRSKYRYLEEPSLQNRLSTVLEDINYEKAILELENKINATVKKSIDESQKEYYLREKLKAIQSELGDKARQEEEIERFREKINTINMPQVMKDKCLQELNKYSMSSSQTAESQIIRTWLDFVTELPWDAESEDVDDLKKLTKKLDEHHYGLEKVKDRIVEYLAVKVMTKKNPQTILCLAGPPGVGKTSLAISIADALGRKFVKQALGGVRDESEIRGHRRTYVGALPGRILKAMKDAKTVNPVLLLDEIDKMASDFRGDPAAAMLEVLDPEQNAKFSDNYVEESYDLSKVMFITTANDLSKIPAPLRDRMEIIEVSSYTEFEKVNIALNHLLPKQLNAHGLKEGNIKISLDTMLYIIASYTKEAGVRELNRVLASITRKVIKEILIDKIKSVEITKENVTKYLGKLKFTTNDSRNEDQVGVVTGLAYTSFGGDTLDIEVTHFKGKGNLVLTGKLGDVMKESGQAALSYIKSVADKHKIDPKFFSENDIHIHVPEGAIPKDGPSAGITMTTAILSALTGKKTDKTVGMTGEVTLRGNVLPIGGLKEKAIAAHRSGLKTIIIPKENEKDVEDIPQEVREKLEIIPVAHVEDVLKRTIK